MNALATSLQTYFTTFARTQRDLSANTIASYRDTWRMLLKYLTATLGVPADVLDFDAVTQSPCFGDEFRRAFVQHRRGLDARADRDVLVTAGNGHGET